MQSNKSLEILVISRDPATAESVRQLVADAEIKANVQASAELVHGLESPPELVIADAALLMSGQSVDGAALTSLAPAQVYVLAADTDVDVVRQFMKAGVRDVLASPLRGDELKKELEQVMETRDAQPDDGAGRLISFTDVKGGGGATTLAVNVAHALAAGQQLSVLLVDLDIQFGDMATFLDMRPRSSVLEALAQSRRLDATLLASLTLSHDSGIELLSAPLRPAELSTIQVDDLRRLLEVAVASYDVVIADVPRIFCDWTREIWRWSDHCFFALQGSVADLRAGRILLEDIARHGVDVEHVHFIHNRRGTRHESSNDDVMKKTFSVDKIFDIRNDYPAAVKAQDAGKPVMEVAPGSNLARDIGRLAEEVAELCNKPLRKRPGLFDRLFAKKHQ